VTEQETEPVALVTTSESAEQVDALASASTPLITVTEHGPYRVTGDVVIYNANTTPPIFTWLVAQRSSLGRARVGVFPPT
jgi:hypothetical protein